MNDFKYQPFYNKLTPKFSEKVAALLLKNTVLKTIKTFEYGCLGLSCLIILLNYNNFRSEAETLRSLMMFGFAGVLILLSNEISKESRKSYDKAVQKVKDEMLFDICGCNYRCSCRQEFREYLSKVSIDLSKKEDTSNNSKSNQA